MHKIIITILFFLPVITCAQTSSQGSGSWPRWLLLEEMVRIVEKEVELVDGYPKAQGQTEEILDAYLANGEAGIDTVFANMDVSWFSAVTLYLDEDMEAILHSLENQDDNQWRLPHNKKATIAVACRNGTFAAVVFSFP